MDLLFPGAFYATAPVITFVPRKPYLRVTANEWSNGNATRGDPGQVGHYSKQGKGVDELDPEAAHGSWPAGALSTVRVARFPNATATVCGTQ